MERFHWVLLGAIPWCLGYSLDSYVSVNLAPFPLFWLIPMLLFWFSLALAFFRLSALRPTEMVLSMACQAIVAAILLAMVTLIFFLFKLYNPLFIPIALFTTVLLHLPHRFTLLLQPVITIIAVVFFLTNPDLPVMLAMYFHIFAFWFNCWGCIGILGRGRPPAVFIPELIFCIALGILLGTAFIIWLVPILFPTVVTEYPLFLILACLLRFLPAPAGVARNDFKQ